MLIDPHLCQVVKYVRFFHDLQYFIFWLRYIAVEEQFQHLQAPTVVVIVDIVDGVLEAENLFLAGDGIGG